MRADARAELPRLLLAGGGHSHALLLRMWAMRPRRRPQARISLISRSGTAYYSGMVPGLVAGLYQSEEVTIDLRQLCAAAGVQFIAPRQIPHACGPQHERGQADAGNRLGSTLATRAVGV